MAYRIWRQDDNGNVFLVGTFAKQREAEERLTGLTRVLHKQIYWIDDDGGAERAHETQEEE